MKRGLAGWGSVFAMTAALLWAGGCTEDGAGPGGGGQAGEGAAGSAGQGGSGGIEAPGGSGGQELGCIEPCRPGEVCVEGVCLGDDDHDGVDNLRDRCPNTPIGAEVDREGCALAEFSRPFSDGPYGAGIRDVAGDFTLSTLGGDWSFRDQFNGVDSLIFFVKTTNPRVLEAWNGDVARLLAESPAEAKYVFLSADASREDDVRAMKARFDAALAALEPAEAAAWEGRLHFVLDDPRALSGSLGDFFGRTGSIWFAIDPMQRFREVGSLYDFNTQRFELRFLAKEAQGFAYERRLAWELGRLARTEVPVFAGTRHEGGWEEGYTTEVEVDLPSAEEMAGFDSMAVWIYTACPAHEQGLEAGCNEWDYAHHLLLCDREDASRCDVEIVRYVTPYGREGEWLTDISPLLPLVKEGGKRTLRYRGANGYDLHMRLLFWNEGKPLRPTEAIYLWGKGEAAEPFDLSYNDGRHAPVEFEVDREAVQKVEIFASISGHGFGSTAQNCAEFCNHQHAFTLNSTEYLRQHLGAGTSYGCFGKVSEGVVPNQFGSWPFGRAGWCPGQAVEPWVQDVTEGLVSGTNELRYQGLFRGKDYPATPNGQGDYMPEVRVASWLIFYEAAP